MADDMKSITAKSGECGARSHRVVGERQAESGRPTRENRGDTAHRNTKRILCIGIDIASKCVSVDEKLRWLLVNESRNF